MCVFILGSYINANSLVVDSLPVSGESVPATSLWAEHGGKGLNLAVGIHRLGLQTQTLLTVGNDTPGSAVRQFMQAENMDTSLVKQVDVASGFGVGLVSAGGDNVVAVYPGANAHTVAADVHSAIGRLAQCRMVCAQFEIPDEPILEAFRLARQYGVQTLLNPSPLRPFDPDLLALTDILVLNETEAIALFGIAATQDLSVFFWAQFLPSVAWQGKLLVVTLAEHGCVVRETCQGILHAPAWAVDALDPTGSGDAFTAGLVFALLTGEALEVALHFANACGAWVASSPGVMAVLPTDSQVAVFMRDRRVAGSFSK